MEEERSLDMITPHHSGDLPPLELRERRLDPDTAAAKSDDEDTDHPKSDRSINPITSAGGGDLSGEPSARVVLPPLRIHEFPSPTPHGSPLSQQPHYPNALEARYYYHGLPSAPTLLARSAINSIWKQPSKGLPEATKEFRTFTEHVLHDIWEDDFAFKVHTVLESHRVEWTSTELVRFGWHDESSSYLTVWIGVDPGRFDRLNDTDKKEYFRNLGGVIIECLGLLREHAIDDVEVEIRLSTFIPCTPLPAPSLDDIVPDYHSFSTAIGHAICSWNNVNAYGTGGFFMTAEGDDDRLLLVTARHVVFERSDEGDFNNIDGKSLRRSVLLIGRDPSFQTFLRKLEAATQKVLEEKRGLIEVIVLSDENERGSRERLQDLDDEYIALRRLSRIAQEKWGTLANRIFGHVLLSLSTKTHRIDPSYHGGDDRFTPCEFPDDWAIIAVDPGMIRASDLRGNLNVLDLGTKQPIEEWVQHMLAQDPHSPIAIDESNRLLEVKGRIPPRLYRRSFHVLKRGAKSGLTLGYSAGFAYYRYKCTDGNIDVWSVKTKAWAITPCFPFEAFSEPGDSGSTIVDRSGRIGGIMYGGVTADADHRPDITFAIPVDFLCERVEPFGIRNVKF